MVDGINKVFDWVHNRTCAVDGVVFKFYAAVAVVCPCCTFYRGIGIGIATGLVVGVIL